MHVKIQWFVVVGVGGDHSAICLPINTYGKRGATKSGIHTAHHAALVPKGKPEYRLPGEDRLMEALHIQVEDKTETIHPTARINFGKIYTIEHNVKVKSVGRIVPEDLHRLRHYWRSVLDKEWAKGEEEEDEQIETAKDESDEDDDLQAPKGDSARKLPDESASSALVWTRPTEQAALDEAVAQRQARFRKLEEEHAQRQARFRELEEKYAQRLARFRELEEEHAQRQARRRELEEEYARKRSELDAQVHLLQERLSELQQKIAEAECSLQTNQEQQHSEEELRRRFERLGQEGCPSTEGNDSLLEQRL